ncbi:MAG: hypothetical protein JW963_07795, partial [Anaerolineales bacterium]|nr:hypothetical protein [Anaerolineales bacterium]
MPTLYYGRGLPASHVTKSPPPPSPNPRRWGGSSAPSYPAGCDPSRTLAELQVAAPDRRDFIRAQAGRCQEVQQRMVAQAAAR